MLARSLMRSTKCSSLTNMMVRNQMPMLAMMQQQRGFALSRYHFDDKDFEPTVTQVSVINQAV